MLRRSWNPLMIDTSVPEDRKRPSSFAGNMTKLLRKSTEHRQNVKLGAWIGLHVGSTQMLSSLNGHVGGSSSPEIASEHSMIIVSCQT